MMEADVWSNGAFTGETETFPDDADTLGEMLEQAGFEPAAIYRIETDDFEPLLEVWRHDDDPGRKLIRIAWGDSCDYILLRRRTDLPSFLVWFAPYIQAHAAATNSLIAYTRDMERYRKAG